MSRILVVDDDLGRLKVLRIELSEAGYEVETAENAEIALNILEGGGIDFVITDVRMPGMSGTELLREVKSRDPSLPVIILTAFGEVEDAVEAMKAGAADYLLKPIENMDQLRLKVESELRKRRLVLELSYFRGEIEGQHKFEDLVGESPNMKAVFELIHRVARSDSTCLILGESGTGKELVARAIHRQSPRVSRPFVPINCVAIPADLLESELFGHMKGAFTGATETRVGKFELADGGTLFLDEIGDMSPALQGKILRAIQEKTIEPVGGRTGRKVDVRIIAATNTDLETRVREKTFREDLYFRLNVVPIELPPLRRRREDIPLLVKHFLNRFGGGKPPFEVSGDILEDLARYAWPGNIRELENLVERAIVLGTPEIMRMRDLRRLEAGGERPSLPGFLPSAEELISLPYREAKDKVLRALDQLIITAALRRSAGNVSRAADQLDMHRKNLHTKMAELGIDPKAL